MPIPYTTRQGHRSVTEGQGLVAVALGDAAQAFDPADGVFYLHVSARIGVVVGALHIGQGCSRPLVVASGLAVRQTFKGPCRGPGLGLGSSNRPTRKIGSTGLC